MSATNCDIAKSRMNLHTHITHVRNSILMHRQSRKMAVSTHHITDSDEDAPDERPASDPHFVGGKGQIAIALCMRIVYIRFAHVQACADSP